MDKIHYYLQDVASHDKKTRKQQYYWQFINLENTKNIRDFSITNKSHNVMKTRQINKLVGKTIKALGILK